jgi:hypothetical protein
MSDKVINSGRFVRSLRGQAHGLVAKVDIHKSLLYEFEQVSCLEEGVPYETKGQVSDSLARVTEPFEPFAMRVATSQYLLCLFSSVQ